MGVVIAIAVGGALGAVSRYALSAGVASMVDLRGVGTFIVNMIGAFALGAIIGLTEEQWELSDPVRAGVTIGLLGGFTTFSTYMYDVIYHAEDERWMTSLTVLSLTIALGLVAMIGGLAAGRSA